MLFFFCLYVLVSTFILPFAALDAKKKKPFDNNDSKKENRSYEKEIGYEKANI